MNSQNPSKPPPSDIPAGGLKEKRATENVAHKWDTKDIDSRCCEPEGYSYLVPIRDSK